MLNDLRYALRGMRRSPAFAAVAILSLGLGVGVNTAMFSLVDSLLFRPLPVESPGTLVDLFTFERRRRRIRHLVVSGPRRHHGREHGLHRRDGLQPHVGPPRPGRSGAPRAWGRWSPRITSPCSVCSPRWGDCSCRRMTTRRRRAWWWCRTRCGSASLAGAPTSWGSRSRCAASRTPLPAWRPPRSPASCRCSSPSSGCRSPTPTKWSRPASTTPSRRPTGRTTLERRGRRWLFAKGRLKPGVTAEAAHANVALIGTQLAAAHPQTNKDRKMSAVPTADVRMLVPQAGGVLSMGAAGVMAVVGLVLLIACANVAAMLLARASARRREIGVRLAIGASRGRLIRQLLVEGLVLGALGSVAAVACAWALIRALLSVRAAAARERGARSPPRPARAGLRRGGGRGHGTAGGTAARSQGQLAQPRGRPARRRAGGARGGPPLGPARRARRGPGVAHRGAAGDGRPAVAEPRRLAAGRRRLPHRESRGAVVRHRHGALPARQGRAVLAGRRGACRRDARRVSVATASPTIPFEFSFSQNELRIDNRSYRRARAARSSRTARCPPATSTRSASA